VLLEGEKGMCVCL